MKYSISEIKDKTVPIAKNYGISKMYLFGSYARGEATEESDVDLLIEKGELRSLIQYFSFVAELEGSLACHVDVVTTSIEDKAFLGRIREEEVVLYER
jgi:predicted nucleotidyltransferase